MMAGTSNGHDFLKSDRCSDDQTFQHFDEHEYTEDGLLNDFSAHSTSTGNDDITLIDSVPYTGMTFHSIDDARNFYYEYAKHTGFTIRTNRIRHSLKNKAVVIGRDFVCSREGFRAAKHTHRKDRVLPPRPVTREGCKAMIRLAARDKGTWLVTKFVPEHNHELMTGRKYSGELPIVNMLSKEEKDKKIEDLYDELQREKERSAGFRRQIQMILKDIEEHDNFMSVRVEDIVHSMKTIELGDL